LGLNFLATWEAWRTDAQRCERLHFASVEKHPFGVDDLARLHARWPELTAVSGQLVRAWPPLVPGFHRLHFEDGRLTLTLLLGDVAELLPKLRASADVIYLDGFAPEKNPEMWSAPIFRQLARLAKPEATLATWTVAGAVRQGLADAAFLVTKRPGFGRKREMLCGTLPASHTCRTHLGEAARAGKAVVIGAGLAGTHAAERLAARGWQVEVLEQAGGPAQGASGNLAGVLRPLPSIDDNRLARLTRAGFLYALGHLTALAQAGHAPRWQACGVLHLARDPAHAAKQRQAVEALALPPEFVRAVTREEAMELARWPVDAGGWWFPVGCWVNPPSLCDANLAVHGERVRLRTDIRVSRLEYDGGDWLVLDAAGATIARAPVVILANGAQATDFSQVAGLPLRAARGQVSHLPAARTPPLDIVVFQFMLPGYAEGIDPAALDGRVGLRAMLPDRLPMAGELPQLLPAASPGAAHLRDLRRWSGLYGLLGYGARGLVWAALAAELVASRLNGEPLPLPRDLVDALDPARFLLRGHLPKYPPRDSD
ncbi:MAG: bifunctional tRNA (5-methylaminomethyl-2-thiouridine)(34)-methyltransferase MnmD/FAD-dependent, partial [Proteobacteria bacterium]|nr:bifunctional tRNA (5-methylaminomethyl-2-thiouridine)(34)-methyltransferase MnmD/FAD-dependent [Pseudomonadota bacterium]